MIHTVENRRMSFEIYIMPRVNVKSSKDLFTEYNVLNLNHVEICAVCDNPMISQVQVV
jgi:hypothetical protein